MTDDAGLRSTPLDAMHREAGAKMVPFAGHAMPLNYPPGIVAEHLHCRAAAAVFDVSHMGQVVVAPRSGDVADAARALERLMPADLHGLRSGRQRYGFLTNGEGGIRDDLMVANLGDRLLVVVNAACREADLAILAEGAGADCRVEMPGDRALVALQGPQAGAVMARLAPGSAQMRFMDAREMPVAGMPAILTRSGYTGEDGFEISVAAAHAPALWQRLMAEPEVAPAGLGARDTLRLEAGLCLMGSDIDAATSPVEAGLDWAIGAARRAGGARAGGFPGAARILAELAGGPARRRVGLLPEGRAPVRAGAALLADGAQVGTVTSGSFGPSLGRPVAMGYVPAALAAPGTVLEAEARGRRQPVAVAPLPFVAGRHSS